MDAGRLFTGETIPTEKIECGLLEAGHDASSLRIRAVVWNAAARMKMGPNALIL